MLLDRLKNRPVTLFKRKNIRAALGALLGLAAGMSLTTTVVPAAVGAAVGVDPFPVRDLLADYFAHCALVWSVSGAHAARVGRPAHGAAILGTTGLISGGVLALACLGTDTATLLSATFSAALYGILGGLLFGSLLPGDDERQMFVCDRRL